MKKLILFLFGASLVVSACDNMVEVDDTRSNRFDMAGMDVFTAESENPSGHTKTVLNQDGGIDWQPGDSIHIFKGKSDCGAFVATIEEQAITSDFIGQLDYSEEDKDGAYWAIYPYSKDNTCDGKSVTVHIPDKQVATEGTFDNKSFVSIAHSDKQTLSFYNVCGGVKISVTAPDIKRIVFKGNAGESLAGDAIVTTDDSGRPVVQSISNPRTEITLEAPAEKTFEVGKWYYISCLPDSLANGCSVLFRKENDSFSADSEYSIDKPIVIKRSIWGRIQNSDDEANLFNVVGGEYTIVYTTNDNNKAEVKLDSTYCRSHYYSNGYGFVTLVDSLKQLPNSCFKDCTNLLCVMIGGGITTLGEDAFRSCNNLTSITIPESVTSIGASAFNGCSSLTSITIPEGVTSIGDCVFSRCTGISSITIPEGVTSIGYSAFYGCTSLSSITIPESVTSIGYNAFYGCRGLTSITIPKGVTSIENSAFFCCTSLTSITIPEGVTSIGNQAFRQCSSLTGITIPESVTSIGSYAFNGCSSLTSIIIPDSVQSIGNSAFSGCSSLTSIIIPDSVQSIGNSAFSGCSSLTSITIPGSVTSFGYGLFSGCNSLSSFNSPYASEDKRCLIKDGGLFGFCPAGLESYTIPSSVTNIKSSAFAGCSSLISITIPEGVTSIGSYAFAGCKSLTSITIPEGVTSIGPSAFNGCSSLTEMIVLRSTPPSLYANSFESTNIAAIYVPAESVNAYKSASFWRLWGNIIKAILPEAIDLGLSVKWASCNLGAIKPEEYGGYYAWGEIDPKTSYSWVNYKFRISGDNIDNVVLAKYNTKDSYGNVDNIGVLESGDDAASVKLGGKWRIPTDAEWTELRTKCTWTWTDNYNGTGVKGRIVTASNGNCIFLPAAGNRNGTDLLDAGSYGFYWSSSLSTDDPSGALNVQFNSGNVYSNGLTRCIGRSLRPVCD